MEDTNNIFHFQQTYEFTFQFLCLCISEPVTTIHGSPDLYIDTGSTVNLTCIVRHLPEPPATIQWTHNNEVKK